MLEFKWCDNINDKIYCDCLDLRKEVFILEKKSHAKVEIDSEDKCIYLGLYKDDLCLGTGRLFVDKGEIFLQRIAIKKGYRKLGYGKILIENLEEKSKALGFKNISVNANINALGFYLNLGYNEKGSYFKRCGIDHVKMVKAL